MKTGIFHIVSLALALLFTFPCMGKKKDVTVPYLETRIDRNHTVEGERLIYEVVLVSPDPDVAGAEVMANPEFKGLDIARAASDSRLEEVSLDGRLYYRAVIDRFFIGTNTHGNYTVKGGDYRVGLNRKIAVDDPIWGPSVANRIEMFALSAPDLKIKVDRLPESGRPDNFSGAVGRFEVELEAPGPVRQGEEIRLDVTVAGFGDLSEANVPNVVSALPAGLQFKSMTESRSHFIKQGSLGSELQMECIIVADKEGKYEISPVEFSFFDSLERKYVTVRSNPIEIEVGGQVHTNETPPVIMDV